MLARLKRLIIIHIKNILVVSAIVKEVYGMLHTAMSTDHHNRTISQFINGNISSEIKGKA